MFQDYVDFKRFERNGWESRPVPGNPKVSMVVSAFNRPNEIRVTLACFLCQTHQNFEILVVHDGPGDGSVLRAVESMGDGRIQYLELPENTNDWGNSCKEWGSLRATGDYIGHSNDDNYYAPVYFEALLWPLVTGNGGFAYSDMVHSHMAYRILDTAPQESRMDGGGWICRADVVKGTKWPDNKRDPHADGRYLTELAQRAGAVKIPHLLFVHN